MSWSTTVEEAKSLGTKDDIIKYRASQRAGKRSNVFDPKKIDSFQDIILKFISNQNYQIIEFKSDQKYSEIEKLNIQKQFIILLNLKTKL